MYLQHHYIDKKCKNKAKTANAYIIAHWIFAFLIIQSGSPMRSISTRACDNQHDQGIGTIEIDSTKTLARMSYELRQNDII